VSGETPAATNSSVKEVRHVEFATVPPRKIEIAIR